MTKVCIFVRILLGSTFVLFGRAISSRTFCGDSLSAAGLRGGGDDEY